MMRKLSKDVAITRCLHWCGTDSMVWNHHDMKSCFADSQNKSSVAQLASASDCYTSGYQEVGSSSLPGGGLSFCSSSIHQSYSCSCGGTFARMSCRIMFLLHVPLAVSVVAFMCSFLGEEILQTQRTYIDCYTLFLQTDSCVCHPFTRMM